MRFHDTDMAGQPTFGERRFRPESADDDSGAGRGRGRGHAHGHGGRGGRGGPGFGGPAFAGPGFGGPGFGFGFGLGGPRRGPRPRGDVRAAILLLLAEQPRHGYELIQEIAERSDGAWTPSPGSVYPALQALEDEGLLVIEPVAGRKTASLTQAGEAYVSEERDRLGDPFTVDGGDRGQASSFRDEIRALAEAFTQVMRVGSADQKDAALGVLTKARKELYRILADDSTED